METKYKAPVKVPMKPQEIIALLSLFSYQILTKNTNNTFKKNTTTTTPKNNENHTTTNVTTDENIKNRTAVNSTKIPGNLTNVLLCKVTHLGVDYAGSIGKSESGVRCQSWTAKNPIHKVDPLFTDDKFSDFSKTKAKHYCRNPNNEPLGPWCYTMDPDNIWETCGLPLCSYTECRITGPGMEYAGFNKKTITGRNCLKWNKKRPQVRHGKDLISIDKYNSHLFPDEIRSDAKKFCRNPDGDIGGPWCFVETTNKKIVEKQYCDVPFCDDETCMVFTKNDEMYTHYTKFYEEIQNFTFGVKLWDPDQFLNASARLVLSLYALPVVATQIHDLGIGVEITITNKKAALTAGYANKVEYENAKGFIKGHKFVYFSLTWWHNVITLFLEGKKQPILMADLNSKDTVMSHNINEFSFYAAQGTNMLWSFPYCDIEDYCDVYTTTQKNFQHFHPLRETSQGRDLEFHLRAFRSAYLLLVSSPTVQYPNFMIMLQRSDNITRFMYKNDVNSSAEVIAELFSDNILKYWTFQEFAVSIFLEECQILVTKNGATHTLLTVKHESLKKMRWFSPSSEDTIAHWTFFCFPPDDARAPTAWLPECVLNKNEPYYNGTQAVTSQGNPCLPWAGQNIMPLDINSLFKSKEDKFKANNYCRDPKNEQKGTFCYTFQYDDKDLVVKQEKCHIRKCVSAECKMAGTGNDYIGKLSTTRSNRTCQHWLSSSQLKNLEYTAKKVTENSTLQNIPIIEDPDAAASNKQKEEQLRVLNTYLENAQCDDKMRCLRSMFKVRRRTRSNQTGGNGNDEHVNDSLKPSQEYSEDVPIVNKTKTTANEQAKTDQNSTEKNQIVTKEKPDNDESSEASSNSALDNSDSDPYFNISHNPPHELEVMHLEEIGGNPLINKMVEESVETTTSKYDYPYVHEVDQVLLNETLFADMNLLKIENFCRNPNRDVGGAWCYTTDPHVRFDLCNVRDCDKPEECTIIVLGGETGRKNYILPQWKETGHHGGIKVSLKQWNPDLITSFAFEFFPFEGMNTSLKIIIGAEENEKLQCFFNGELVRHKTLPHLIPTGKWTGFWIQVRQGEIMIGFDGVPNPFFEWKHDHFATVFNPIMVNYYTQNHLPIGAYFGCDDCHLENVTTAQFTRFFPIGLWKEEGQTYKNFTMKVRGTGNLLIPLYILPNTHEFYAIEIGTKDGTVKVYQYGPGFAVTRKTTFNKDFQIPTNAWANLTIIFTESRLVVFSNTDDVMYFHNKQSNLLFYYFSVGVQNGWITWAANCDPMDIDGPPIDGGWSQWSPWICTVTCGGGQGYRTRTCSNPRPNVFGKMCEGSPTSTGSCNEFECGDISPETLDMIRQHLRDNYTSLVVNEDATVSIMNYPPILNRITTESPDSYYEWTRNGLFLEPEPGRLEFSGDDIIITNATTKDSGVYVTMLFRINKQRVVLHVVSLAVNTKSYMIDTRATRKATLLTHSVVLGYVYKDLRQKWTLNDKTYIDYGITTMAAVSQEYIHPLNESHTGDWRCIVEQSDMNFRWTTNIIKMRVKTAPTLWTNLMEDEVTAPLFSWLKTETNVQIALAVLVITVIVAVALGLFLYLKVCRLKQPHLLKKKKSAKKQKRNRRFR